VIARIAIAAADADAAEPKGTDNRAA